MDVPIRNALNEEWARKHQKLFIPEPEEYTSRFVPDPEGATIDIEPPRHVNLRADHAGEGLQVIVELFNIHLTPDQPEYPGGNWHLEGSLNERICASALYCYDNENVTDNYLSFRESTNEEHLDPDFHDAPGEWALVEDLHGLKSGGPAIQELGRVLARQGRLVAYPNVLQNKTEPFSLVDKTRPGYRKVLALHLVDPHTRIPSTAHVPPQQKQWWRDLVFSVDRVAALPVELAERVVDTIDCIDLAEAKRLRLELMEEHKAFNANVTARMEQQVYRSAD